MDGINDSALGLEEHTERTTMSPLEGTSGPKVGEVPSTIPTTICTDMQKSFEEVVVTHHDSPAVESEEEDSGEQIMNDPGFTESTTQAEVDEAPEEEDPEVVADRTETSETAQDTIEELPISTMTSEDSNAESVQDMQEPAYWRQASASDTSLKLLCLPIDALHCIASFMTAADWAHFGQTNTIATPICRDVFQRVRMHGFRCATEAVTAWKLGQHADARELSALYIQSGVPIYPSALGHSYHTLVWRMGVEAKEMEQNQVRTRNNTEESEQETPADGEASEEAPRPIDPFFTGRYDARVQEGDDGLSATYLEEKCLYCYNKAAETDIRLGMRVSMTSRTTFAPPAPVLGAGMHGIGAWDGRTRLPGFRPAGGVNTAAAEAPGLSPPRSQSPSNSSGGGLVYQDASRVPPKVKVSLHRHLVDQHLLGRRATDDENGAMVTSPISLAADFFHQNLGVEQPFAGVFDGSTPDGAISMGEGHLTQHDIPAMLEGPNAMIPSGNVTPNSLGQGPRLFGSAARLDGGEVTGFANVAPDEATGFVDSSLDGDDVLDPPDFGSEHSSDGINSAPSYGTPLQPPAPSMLPSPPPPPPVPTPDELSSIDFPMNSEPTILSGVDLEIYTSASAKVKSLADLRDGTSELKSHLMTRYAVYQRRLETLLSHNDSPGFEECLFDFWDEFLPTTANIHFHDRNTAVPRISGLQKFLSKPCPKAFGVVQCEIERIKINSKRKGMKGRLFPTYEYRLFIRDKRHETAVESATDENSKPVRRDTILMMAKNRGRKHQESAGVMPAPGSSKKGVNNYYLYMPQQVDVDTHYRVINGSDDAELVPNGASSTMPTRLGDDKAQCLLGRLQSNFIGTEFQIFTPTLQKHPGNVSRKQVVARSNNVPSSDSESDYEASSDTASAYRRKNRFRRRRSNPGYLEPSVNGLEGGSERRHVQPIEEEESCDSPDRRRKTRRAYSLPNFRRSTRSSRRAVANSMDSPDTAQQTQNMLYEEEDGAITYTANLLGNRPRIMDVCVPRVSNEGLPGAEWKRYLGSVEDSVESANSMLNHFKQVQQRLENPDANSAEQDGNDESGYTPPDDFGLLALQNRPPWWNVELGAFVLNFGGRVSVASVKNFQLCDRTDQDHIMLQFGRIQGRHSFTMDFQHPLTAVQAFAIAISSLQSRISFG